jgi:hypothetical protein
MSKVGREVGQQTLHVLTLSIPRNDPYQGKAVTKIMKPRLVSRLPGTMDFGFFAQLLKNLFGSIASDPLKLYCSQQWCFSRVMDRWPLPIDIGF